MMLTFNFRRVGLRRGGAGLAGLLGACSPSALACKPASQGAGQWQQPLSNCRAGALACRCRRRRRRAVPSLRRPGASPSLAAFPVQMLLFNIIMARRLGVHMFHVASGKLVHLLRSRAGGAEVEVRWLPGAAPAGWEAGMRPVCCMQLMHPPLSNQGG